MLRATTFLSALCLAPFVLSAQSGVAGRVLDPQGKSVAQAVVRLEIAGSIAADARTGATGAFRLDSVAPGRYKVVVESAGFQPGAHDVTIPPGIIAVCDVTRSPASPTSARAS